MKAINKKEFNELCLWFLGYRPVDGMEGMWYTHELHKLNMFSIKEFSFDTDWNQIMSVVEKIVQVCKYEPVNERSEFTVNNEAPIMFCTITTPKHRVVRMIHKFITDYKASK